MRIFSIFFLFAYINEFFGLGKTRYLKDTFVFLCLRKWVKDANEEGSEDERLPSDEGDPKHLTTRRTNQTTFPSELQMHTHLICRTGL